MELRRQNRFLPADNTLPERVPMTVYLDRLRSVIERGGPFLSCYLPFQTSLDLERSRDAIAAAELTPTERSDLQQVIDEAEARMADPQSTDAMVVVLQAADGFGFIEYYPEAVEHPVVDQSDLPRLALAIEAEQRLRHHVLAVLSSDGVDLLTFPRHGAPSLHRTNETDPDRLVHLIAETAKATSTRLILLAGANDSVADLKERLSLDVPIETAVEIIGSTVADVEDMAEAAVQRVSNEHAVDTVETLRAWKFERAHGLASSDLVETVQALRSGDARLLIVSDDADDQRQVWTGPGPQDIAIDLEDAAHSLSGAELRPGRMVDGLVQSALLQRIPIQIVPMLPDSTLPGGVGVLRDTDEARGQV
jgi:hypothetical protein